MDLYLNPDPLARLIGVPNKMTIQIEGKDFTALIASSDQISQSTKYFVKVL